MRITDAGVCGSARIVPSIVSACSCAAQRALDHFGVIIVEEGDGMGAGVRLKFTRTDTRQIARLEGEGGAIGSDDAP
ncbi:MAG: hypothetical protein M0R03_02670 [Novosphingobium sp.]|nr:hypothetical protein [Novosphingobium sp.]